MDTQGISGTLTPITNKHYVEYINIAMVFLKLEVTQNGRQGTSEPTGTLLRPVYSTQTFALTGMKLTDISSISD